MLRSQAMALEIIISDGTQQDEVSAYNVCDEQVRITVEDGFIATIELTVKGKVEILATVQSNAQLTVLCIQTEESVISQKAHLSTAASIHWQNVSLAPVTHTLESRAEGPQARSDIDWIFYAKDKERQVITATNVFLAEEGRGEILIKGVSENEAHVRCDGLINIGLKGNGTNTYLTEDVLMLDSTSKVDAIPGLEIKTNDVKASHSATVSKVTPEDLFYFASRGIGEHEARNMYVQGFLGDLAANIAHQETRGLVLSHIAEKYRQ